MSLHWAYIWPWPSPCVYLKLALLLFLATITKRRNEILFSILEHSYIDNVKLSNCIIQLIIRNSIFQVKALLVRIPRPPEWSKSLSNHFRKLCSHLMMSMTGSGKPSPQINFPAPVLSMSFPIHVFETHSNIYTVSEKITPSQVASGKKV